MINCVDNSIINDLSMKFGAMSVMFGQIICKISRSRGESFDFCDRRSSIGDYNINCNGDSF